MSNLRTCSHCRWKGHKDELTVKTYDINDTDFNYCPKCEGYVSPHVLPKPDGIKAAMGSQSACAGRGDSSASNIVP